MDTQLQQIVAEALNLGREIRILPGGLGTKEDAILIDGLPANMWPEGSGNGQSTNFNTVAAQYAATVLKWDTCCRYGSGYGNQWIEVYPVDAGELLLSVAYGPAFREHFPDYLGESPRDVAVTALRKGGPFPSIQSIKDTAESAVAARRRRQPRVNFANPQQRVFGAVIGAAEWLDLERISLAAERFSEFLKGQGVLETRNPSPRAAELFERTIEGIVKGEICVDWNNCPDEIRNVLGRALKHATII